MKKLLAICAIMAAMSYFGTSSALADAVKVPNGSIVVDGVMTPGEWDSVPVEFDTGPRPCDTPGGWDLSGAKGRFAWDDTNVYGLVEAYPNTCGPGANPNGPFDAINWELYVNANDWCNGASYFLTAWPDGTTVSSPGAVVMGSPDAMLFTTMHARALRRKSFQARRMPIPGTFRSVMSGANRSRTTYPG